MTLLEKLKQSATAVLDQMETIQTEVATRGVPITEAEEANLQALTDEFKVLEERMASAQKMEEARKRLSKARSETAPLSASSFSATDVFEVREAVPDTAGAPVKVTDPPVYHKGNQGLFLRDLVASYVPSERQSMARATRDGMNFQERLDRHSRMARDDVETRAIATSNLPGLVIPAYRRDLHASGLYDGRVASRLCRDIGFPAEGVQIKIPRTTTNASAGTQASEGAAVSTSDPVTEELSVDMHTVGAFTDVSIQAIEQGSMSEKFVLEELMMATAEHIEDQVVNGSGTGGNVTGLNTLTGFTEVIYTATAPKAKDLWQKVIKLIIDVTKARRIAPDVLLFSPQTWGFLIASTDTNGRPIYTNVAQGPSANIGVGDIMAPDVRMPTPAGQIAGVNCYVVDKIPVNLAAKGTSTPLDTSRIFAFNRRDPLIAESSASPTIVAGLETSDKKLNVRFTAYSFMFFTAGRYPTGIGKMDGTGLDAKL